MYPQFQIKRQGIIEKQRRNVLHAFLAAVNQEFARGNARKEENARFPVLRNGKNLLHGFIRRHLHGDSIRFRALHSILDRHAPPFADEQCMADSLFLKQFKLTARRFPVPHLLSDF